MLLIILGRILYRVLFFIGTPTEAMAAYGAIAVLLYFAALVWLVVRSRAAARQWLAGLGTVAPLAGLIGRHWLGVGIVFFAVLAGTQFYGAVTDRVHVAAAMLLTLNLVVGVLVFETLLQAFVRRLDSQLVGQTPASDTPKLPDVIARCVRVAVLIAVAVAISESWVVEVLGLVSEDEWARFTRSSRTAGITLFLAFVVWELFKYKVDPYMGRKPAGAAGPLADGDGAVKSASRLSTLMPLLRIAMAIVIGVVALLVALDDFGINITPLIAGASVVGLAISFGSQTLVRDIVSGIFYLADDAFRVGEYIDCGKAKGTVEGFTLRSIRLRHQNGQVHTIPFGQLGQITNFSRDWITLKFNLRFARDTDLEKLRKAAKKIGTDMLEIPELKAETLAPFKMQGIADITDNALLVRFKFTAKPGNPASIQREAVKRMIRTFPELGIEFAKEGAAVILQTTGASPDGQASKSNSAVAEEAALPRDEASAAHRRCPFRQRLSGGGHLDRREWRRSAAVGVRNSAGVVRAARGSHSFRSSNGILRVLVEARLASSAVRPDHDGDKRNDQNHMIDREVHRARSLQRIEFGHGPGLSCLTWIKSGVRCSVRQMQLSASRRKRP